MGLLEGKALSAPPDTPVSDVMKPGPTTYRPYIFLEDALHYMREQKVRSVLVTDSDGRLMGVLLADDARQAPAERRERSTEARGRSPYRP